MKKGFILVLEDEDIIAGIAQVTRNIFEL